MKTFMKVIDACFIHFPGIPLLLGGLFLLLCASCGKPSNVNTAQTVWTDDATYYTCTGDLKISYKDPNDCECVGGEYREACFVVHPSSN